MLVKYRIKRNKNAHYIVCTFHYYNRGFIRSRYYIILTKTALNRLSWNLCGKMKVAAYELAPTRCLLDSIKSLSRRITNSFGYILLHIRRFIATIVMNQMKMEISPRFCTPGIRHITFPLSYLSPSSLVPESIPALAIRNCPQFIFSTGDGKTHLVPRSEYHPWRKRQSVCRQRHGSP